MSKPVAGPGGRPGRPLILAVVALNLVGAIALIVALTRGSPARATAPTVAPIAHAPAPAHHLQAHFPGHIKLSKPARPRVATPHVPARPHAATPPAPTPAPAPLASAGSQASFASLAASLGGAAGIAVAPLSAGPIQTFGSLQIAHAWSTSKVPVLTTLLLKDAHNGQTLSPEEQADATLALTQSDNAAIEALFGDLEQVEGGLVPASTAVQQVLRTAGDETTIINTAPNDQGFTTYGQSEWSPTGEVQFYRAMADGCLLDTHDTAYVLGLMRDVIPSQRWGAGAAGYPTGLSLAFKGGWGPGSDGGYQVRQTAIIGSGENGYVLSMLAIPASGTFADGTSMLTSLATWAQEHFALNASTPPGPCAAAANGASDEPPQLP